MMKTVNPARSSNRPITMYLPAEEDWTGPETEGLMDGRGLGVPDVWFVADRVYGDFGYCPAVPERSMGFDPGSGLRSSHEPLS